MNLARAFFDQARSHPDRTALVVDQREYSYHELARGAGQVASWLLARTPERVEPMRVGVLASRSFEAYAGILGACAAGATYVPVSPRAPAARIAAISAAAEVDAWVVDGKAAPPQGPAPVLGPEDFGNIKPLAVPVAVSAAHPAYLMFTSGTTGRSKGVVVSTGAVNHFLEAMRARYGIGPEDRVSQFFELSFDLSVFDLFASLGAGASLHVVPEEWLALPSRFIRDRKLTIWASVPSVIAGLLKLRSLKPGAFPSLRASFFCGEALPVAWARAWAEAAPGSAIDNHYGPTEATVAFMTERLTDSPNVTPERGILAIGKPYEGLHAAILGEDGGILPVGAAGELVLSGAQLATGYFRDEALTSLRFPILRHPELGEGRWYRTGDLARQDAAGSFHFLGRADHQIKLRGHRVELEEIDAHLRKACEAGNAAAVAWPVDEGGAQGIVAFVAGSTVEPQAALALLRSQLPAYLVPAEIRVLDELPRTPNGKIDRKALLALLSPKG